MSSYQSYDFIKDIDTHINNKISIDLSTKSDIFKAYLFKLKLFQLNNRIKKDHPIFDETYFLFTKYNLVYVAKRMIGDTLKFDYIEIINAMKIIRKMKLKKIFPQ